MHNYMKTILSAVKTWANGRIDVRIKDSVADWNQNDSSADNYIKNRPFYEKDGIVHTIDPKYLPEEYATVNDVDIIRDAVDVAQDTADMAITNAATAQSTADGKMNATNPVGSGSFSMNRKSGTTVGDYSHAEGYTVTASGSCSHAEGYCTDARGDYSHAEGSNTVAIGHVSHVEGKGTKTISNYSHIEGKYNVVWQGYDTLRTTDRVITIKNEAIIYYALEYDFDINTGLFTLINPSFGIWENVKNVLTNRYDYTRYYFIEEEGKYSSNTICANNSNSLASSQFGHSYSIDCVEEYSSYLNTRDAQNGMYAHTVGNGTSDTNRSNAHTLDWAGNAWYAGDVYVGSISGTNKDDGSKKLATEEYVQQSAKNYVILTDSINSYDYIVQMQDGNLTSICKTASISATAQPAKTEYVVGDTFDPAGMVIIATAQDGSTRVVENYTYTETLASGDTSVTITYIEAGVSYSTTVPVTVTE